MVSLLNRIQGIDAEDPLQSETQVHVLRSLRRALAVAAAVAGLYAELTPLNQLKQANSLRAAWPRRRRLSSASCCRARR